jgi:nitrogen fixation protein FixH
MPPSSTLPGSNDAPPRRSLWIPGVFVGLMLLVIAVNGALVYFASSTFSGLDTDHAYQEGLDYNATLAEAAANAALGWQAEIVLEPTAQGDRLSLRLTDKSGRPISGATVTAHLVRPVNAAFDRTLALTPVIGKAGFYRADISLPARGSWELRLVARGNNRTWQVTEHVFLK